MKQWLSLGLTILLLNPAFAAEKTKAPAKDAAVKSTKPLTQEAKKKSTTISLDPSVSFKPDNLLLEVAPGTTLNEKILVQNNEDIEFQAQLVVVPVFTDESGHLMRAEQTKELKGKHKGKTAVGIKPLPFLDAQIQEKIITVKPKQISSIPIAFKVPEDAKGSYYFQYSVQPLNSELVKIRKAKMKKAGKTTGAVMAITVKVYSIGAITVKDKAAINVTSFNQIKYLPQAKQIMIQSKLTNKGNDYARKYTGVAVVSKGGTVVAKFDLNNVQDVTMLVPGATQLYAGAVEAALPQGDYEVLLTYKDFKGNKLSTFKEVLKVN
jgi:hypothetical protein